MNITRAVRERKLLGVRMASATLFMLSAVSQAAHGTEIRQGRLFRALRFADVYNWHDAAPLFARAERLFREERNTRNALYAHLGALRLTPSLPIEARSRQIGCLLSTNKLLQTDRSLRLFALSVKGQLDGEIDSAAARAD
jgi:hypothetical protein